MRIALGIEYQGENYFGWQKQNDFYSVQQALEEALSIIADEPIQVVCAGRTDTGVNATGQVVHFDTTKCRKNVAWTLGTNNNLPKDIAVKWATEVSDDFHARFSATARRYRYIIYNGRLRPAILFNALTFNHQPLDESLMQQAAQCLVGEHDFNSFRTVRCQANSAIRTIKHCNVTRFGDYIVVDVKANAFLHHMVRNIVGSLMRVGQGLETVEWMAEVLALKDRTKAGKTADSKGLYFVDVQYPDQFILPKGPLGPLFLD